jgi:hypothetical protein
MMPLRRFGFQRPATDQQKFFAPLFFKKAASSCGLTRRNKNLWTGEWRFDKRAGHRGILLKEGLMKSSIESPFGMSHRADLARRAGSFFA